MDQNLAHYQQSCTEMVSYLIDTFEKPEHILALTELVSNTLVKAAEYTFDCSDPNQKPKRNTFMSKTHKQAYHIQEKVCKEWRQQGRPSDRDHPARIAKIESQRN